MSVPDTSARFGTASIPVPVTSVRFGMNSIPVPESSVSSVCSLKYTPSTGIPFTEIPGVPVFFWYGLNTLPYATEHSGMVRYELNTGAPYFGRFGTNSTPVPDTLISSYDLNAGIQHFDKFGTPTQIYPGYLYILHHNTGGTGICSTRPQHPTEHSGMIRHELNTGTRYFGKFGTILMPVPEVPVSSVRLQKYTQVPVYSRPEHRGYR